MPWWLVRRAPQVFHSTPLAEPDEPAAVSRMDQDRGLARVVGRHDLMMVAEHAEGDFDDAVDLYGIGLVSRAIGVAGNRRIKLGTRA